MTLLLKKKMAIPHFRSRHAGKFLKKTKKLVLPKKSGNSTNTVLERKKHQF
jgi:hypothetical protein